MKRLIVTLVAIMTVCLACEKHRKLEEMRRTRIETRIASDRLRRAREAARDRVREAIERESNHGDRTTTTSNWRFASQLPPRSKFCGGSDIYYCPIEATCRLDATSGAWRCVTERLVVPDYRSSSHGRRFYPRPTQHRPRLTCRAGFKLAPDNSTCLDIDECLEENRCQGESEICKNYRGGFYCKCESGYEKKEGVCVDVDECSIPSVCGIGSCVNSDGSHRCDCPTGYEKIGARSCVDVDECASTPCGDDEVCFNTWGGFMCELPRECPEHYVTQRTSDRNTQVCVLLNPGSNSTLPNVLSYRNVLVPAKTRADYEHELGSLTFRSPNSKFHHRFEVSIVEGADEFSFQRRYSGPNELRVEFFNKVPLESGVELVLVFLITDSPRRKGRVEYRYDPVSGRYSRPDPILPTTRQLSITVIPGVHGQ